MIKYPNIHAYLLAGGKSSRMGTDKGLLHFQNKYLVEWVINELQFVFEKITIVANNAAYQKFNLEVIEDEIKNIGPAGGIFTALKHAHTKSIFVVSCDMPFITAKAIGFVVGQSAGTQITIPVYHTKMQPLFAVYSKSCLPIWEQLIEQKFIKLQEMVAHFDLLKLNVDHNIIFDEKVLMNINDKNDLKKGLQFLKNEN